MSGELSKKFHGIGIGPLSKILAVERFPVPLYENLGQNSKCHLERTTKSLFLDSLPILKDLVLGM